MEEFITTYSGIHFYPTKPVLEDIRITDIAHALSMLCRGNGHVVHFFSVGQHCINCCVEAECRGYSDRLILACLLHDAAEAYMSDVTRPLKAYMPDYVRKEEYLLDVIYEKYLGSILTEKEKVLVKRIDDDMLYYDLLYLLNEPQAGPAPVMKSAFTQNYEPFDKVEKRYLELFYKYYGAQRPVDVGSAQT